MGTKREQYMEFYERLSAIADGRDYRIPADQWERATAVWQLALKDAGIHFNFNGSYTYKQKRLRIEYLLFPGRLIVSPAELGDNKYTWGNVIGVYAKNNGMGSYIIQAGQLGNGDTQTITDCLVETDNFIKKKLSEENKLTYSIAQKIVRYYQLRLYALIFCPDSRDFIVGWDRHKNINQYQFSEKLASYKDIPPSTLVPPNENDISAIFFSVTIFSLLKTPLLRMKILTKEGLDFAVYVSAAQPVERDNRYDYLRSMNNYAELFCNYRKWSELSKDYDNKFRLSLARKNLQSAWKKHLHFPLVFTDYPREDIPDISDYAFHIEPQWSEKLFGKLSCLPILLLQRSVYAENVHRKNILTLRWNAEMAAEYKKWFEKNGSLANVAHEHVMGGYVRFLQEISDTDIKQFKRVGRKARKQAEMDAGMYCSNPTQEQRWCRSLLCALYIAQEYNTEDTLFQGSVRYAIRYLKASVVRFATIEDFAKFIQTDAQTQDILFYRDDTGIYLHYKAYWPAFEAYCRKSHIVLAVGAAQFRRTVLSEYIRPQYKPTTSQYPRYDYRKKVNDIEAVVLNVDPKILDLIKS